MTAFICYDIADDRIYGCGGSKGAATRAARLVTHVDTHLTGLMSVQATDRLIAHVRAGNAVAWRRRGGVADVDLATPEDLDAMTERALLALANDSASANGRVA